MRTKPYEYIKKRTVFLKFFLSMILISAISVIVLTLSMFYWYEKNMTKDLKNSERIALTNIDTVVSGYFDTAKRTSMEIYNNPEVRTLMFTGRQEWDENMQKACFRVLNSLSFNPGTVSIMVLNNDEILVNATKVGILALESHDKLFLDLVKNNSVSKPIPWKLKVNAYQNSNIISCFFAEKIKGTDNIDGAVVINLDMDIIHGEIFSAVPEYGRKIIVADRNGTILLHNDMSLFGKSISDKEFFQDVLKSNKNSDNFQLNMDKKKYSIGYVFSKSKDYYVISLIEHKMSIIQLIRARNVMLVLSAVLLIVILFVSYITSYRMYKPIDQVFKNIRSLFSGVKSETGYNEIQLVSQSISAIVENLNAYEKEKEFYRLRSLLESEKQMSEKEYQQQAEWLGVTSGKEVFYRVIVARVANHREFIGKNTAQAISFHLSSMGSIISSLLPEGVAHKHCEIRNEFVVVLIYSREDTTRFVSIDFNSIMKESQEAVYRILGIETTIGISSLANSFTEIAEAYNEAIKLTEYRIMYGRKAIIDASLVGGLEKSQEKLKYTGDELQKYAKQALEAAKTISRSEFEKIVEKMLNACIGYSYERYINFFSNFAFSLTQIHSELGSTHRDKNTVSRLADIMDSIHKLEDTEQLKEFLLSIYCDVSERLESVNSSKTPEVARKALEFIERHYYDANVTASYLAEMFSVSPSYFSRVFHEYTGYNFPEYINKLRLEKAKELLIQNRNSDIADIGRKIGYENSSYFIAAFKKKYGTTPSKFRLEYLSEENEV